MIAGIAATKADLTEWVYEQGLTALHLLLKEDAEEIAGPGKHEKGRTHNHWGSTNGELSFNPSTSSSFEVGRGGVASTLDSLPRRRPASRASVESDLGSTRNYESSLDKPAAKLKSRGTSKPPAVTS